MYYDYPLASEEIEQGDIFLDIPRVALTFSALSIVEEGRPNPVSLTWQEVVDNKKDVAAILGVASVPAIVATQSCDAQRRQQITLCEIVKLPQISAFAEYEGWALTTRVKQLIRHNKEMPGIFVLSPDEKIGFFDRMAVDFSSTIRVGREDLKDFIAKRKARLKKFACEHFREKLAHFFHRYAWNEWYVLNKDEIGKYGGYSDLKAEQLYDYQK